MQKCVKSQPANKPASQRLQSLHKEAGKLLLQLEGGDEELAKHADELVKGVGGDGALGGAVGGAVLVGGGQGGDDPVQFQATVEGNLLEGAAPPGRGRDGSGRDRRRTVVGAVVSGGQLAPLLFFCGLFRILFLLLLTFEIRPLNHDRLREEGVEVPDGGVNLLAVLRQLVVHPKETDAEEKGKGVEGHRLEGVLGEEGPEEEVQGDRHGADHEGEEDLTVEAAVRLGDVLQIGGHDPVEAVDHRKGGHQAVAAAAPSGPGGDEALEAEVGFDLRHAQGGQLHEHQADGGVQQEDVLEDDEDGQAEDGVHHQDDEVQGERPASSAPAHRDGDQLTTREQPLSVGNQLIADIFPPLGLHQRTPISPEEVGQLCQADDHDDADEGVEAHALLVGHQQAEAVVEEDAGDDARSVGGDEVGVLQRLQEGEADHQADQPRLSAVVEALLFFCLAVDALAGTAAPEVEVQLKVLQISTREEDVGDELADHLVDVDEDLAVDEDELDEGLEGDQTEVEVGHAVLVFSVELLHVQRQRGDVPHRGGTLLQRLLNCPNGNAHSTSTSTLNSASSSKKGVRRTGRRGARLHQRLGAAVNAFTVVGRQQVEALENIEKHPLQEDVVPQEDGCLDVKLSFYGQLRQVAIGEDEGDDEGGDTPPVGVVVVQHHQQRLRVVAGEEAEERRIEEVWQARAQASSGPPFNASVSRSTTSVAALQQQLRLAEALEDDAGEDEVDHEDGGDDGGRRVDQQEDGALGQEDGGHRGNALQRSEVKVAVHDEQHGQVDLEEDVVGDDEVVGVADDEHKHRIVAPVVDLLNEGSDALHRPNLLTGGRAEVKAVERVEAEENDGADGDREDVRHLRTAQQVDEVKVKQAVEGVEGERTSGRAGAPA
ncbi:hypothetical protein TYRP_015247 [Tyrophagus putrescentiae]|nr:hypothetical protein TYRP_015247 [Tyrophagus putrescentiae]